MRQHGECGGHTTRPELTQGEKDLRSRCARGARPRGSCSYSELSDLGHRPPLTELCARATWKHPEVNLHEAGLKRSYSQIIGVSDAPAKGGDETSLMSWPGEDAFSHQAKAWKLAEERWFTSKGLHEPLHQRPIPKIFEITLAPTDELRALLPEPHHVDYPRQMERLIKLEAENKGKEQQRYNLQMKAYTDIYMDLEKSLVRNANHLIPWGWRRAAAAWRTKPGGRAEACLHRPYAAGHSQPQEHTCSEAHAQSAQFPARRTHETTRSCATRPWGHQVEIRRALQHPRSSGR